MKVKPEPSVGSTPDPPAPRPFLARYGMPIIATGTLLLGFSPILVRLSEVGPVATGVNRMLLPLPIFFAWMVLNPTQRLPLDRPGAGRVLAIIGLSGAFFAADLVAWHWSIALTSVANATVLANLSPVFVVIAAWLLFNERVNRMFVAGLVTAVAGVAMLMGESLAVSARTLTGDALAVVASWFYAGYFLTVARVRKAASTVATMAWGGLVASVILYAIALAWEGEVWPDTLRGWLAALGLAGVTQVLGQTLIALGLAHVPAGFGAMLLLVQPAFAAVLAWLIFGEALSAWQVAGGLAILSGLYVSRRGAPG